MQKTSSIFLQSIGKPVKATLLSLSRVVLSLAPGVVLLSASSGVTEMLWVITPLADVLSFAVTVVVHRADIP